MALYLFKALTLIYFVCVKGHFDEFPAYKNSSWEEMSYGYSSKNEENYPDDEPGNFTKLNRHKRDRPIYSIQLHHVGLFIAAHKYFGIDRRKTTERKPQFFRHFPSPPLKPMNRKLNSACEQSVIDCILEIYKVISDPGTSSLYPLLHKTVPPLNWPDYYPFKDWIAFLTFRATASYYMCWYTMKREEILAHFMKGKNCLMYLNRVQESRVSGLTIFDWRSDDPNKAFLCAEIMFCPNPCYGRTTGGNIPSPRDMANDEGNPCNRFQDKSCEFNPDNNMNLLGLIRNQLNYSCRCSKGQVGIYNPKSGTCHVKGKKILKIHRVDEFSKKFSEMKEEEEEEEAESKANVPFTWNNWLFAFLHVLVTVLT